VQNNCKEVHRHSKQINDAHALKITLIIHTHFSEEGPPRRKLLVASNPFFPSLAKFLKVGESHERGKKYETRKE